LLGQALCDALRPLRRHLKQAPRAPPEAIVRDQLSKVPLRPLLVELLHTEPSFITAPKALLGQMFTTFSFRVGYWMAESRCKDGQMDFLSVVGCRVSRARLVWSVSGCGCSSVAECDEVYHASKQRGVERRPLLNRWSSSMGRMRQVGK
jgi:hypothetical protein